MWLSTLGVVALIAFLASGCGGGGEAQRSGPLGSPDSVDLTPFSSSIYGFSLSYPTDWQIRAATRRLSADEYPDADSTGIEYFSETAPSEPGHGTLSLAIGAAEPNVPGATTLDGWVSTVEEAHMRLLGCDHADARENIQIDGEPGRLLTWNDCPVFLLWAETLHGDHALHLWLVDVEATHDQAKRAADRRLFEQVLDTVAFAS